MFGSLEIGKRVSEQAVFDKTHFGRAEMRKKCVQAIKKAKPEDRLWVRLDIETNEYVLLGSGAEPPANWIGYKPVDIGGEEIL